MFVAEFYGQHAGDVSAQLGGEGRAEITVRSLFLWSRGNRDPGQTFQIVLRDGFVSRIGRLHELFPEVMNDVVSFLGAHPCLRSHQSIALGQGHEHRVRIIPELEGAFAEGRGNGQGRVQPVASVAVCAEVFISCFPSGIAFCI